MHKQLRCAVTLLLLLAAQPVVAALSIFACTPEWSALSKEIGGDKVSIYTATNALQDPHHVEARPSLIARARSADLVVCTGADLEVGWLPMVLSQAGNPRVRVGQPGYFEAARQIVLLEVPTMLDRSQGDVHPGGNPHVHLDPRNIVKIAGALSERMAQLDAAEAEMYRARTKTFLARWQQAIARWEKDAGPLKGMAIVGYHKSMTYLNHWLGIREIGNLEPKPGLPPTTAHMSELLARLAKDPARAVVRSAYNDPRAAEWLSAQAKIPAVTLPYTVGGTAQAKDLFGLFDDTVARLLAVAK
jgi:zinc/manganese transport system substrate-binding protein